MDENMEYIGDGVYAIFEENGIWLHANNHQCPTDRIYLEPNVLEALNKFYQKRTKKEEDSCLTNL